MRPLCFILFGDMIFFFFNGEHTTGAQLKRQLLNMQEIFKVVGCQTVELEIGHGERICLLG